MEAFYFDEGVRTSKRQQLESKLLQVLLEILIHAGWQVLLEIFSHVG